MPPPDRTRSNERTSQMAKRKGNRELKKPKQNKPRNAAASSVAELAKAGKAMGGRKT
jgi:hypothetical protein